MPLQTRPYNSFFKKRCNHKLVISYCLNCGAKIVHCPICHPDQYVCFLCERPKSDVPSQQESYYRANHRKKGTFNRNAYYKIYYQKNREELRRRASQRYFSDLEYKAACAQRSNRWLIRCREGLVPGEEERQERHRESRRLSDARHRDRVRAESRRWAEKHRQEKRARDRNYLAEHREEINQRRRERYRSRLSPAGLDRVASCKVEHI